MKILIAGGTGLLGQALSNSFLKEKNSVVILTRNIKRSHSNNPQLKYVDWDGISQGEWSADVESADVVINLAGSSIAGKPPLDMRWTKNRKKSILESRVNAGSALSTAIEKATTKPKIFIQTSAVGYYGPSDDRQITENSPQGNDFLSGVCKAWEDSSKSVEQDGVSRKIIRIGLVLSKHGGLFPLLKLPFSLFAGGKFGTGKQYMPWIHIDDIVAAIQFLIENDKAKGIFNLAAPNAVTNTQFGKQIGKIMKKPFYLHAPEIIVKLGLGEVSTLLLDGQNVTPKNLLDSGYKFVYPDLASALNELL